MNKLNARGLAAICGAVSIGVSTASAQEVSIYGLVDLGVEHVNHVGSGHVLRMPSNTGALPSRLGFKGSEDLGGGLSALFNLETGLSADSGSIGQAGRFFGRQAWVGLKGHWGTVALGRQYTMLYWSLLDADLLAPNVYGSSSLDSYIPNARADNSITYMGAFGPWTVGAHYSLGRDVANASSPAGTNCPGESAADSKACRGYSALVKYSTGSWGAALAFDRQHGGPGAFAGLTNSALVDDRISMNAFGKIGAAKVGMGLIHRDNEGSALSPRSDLYFVSAGYPLTPSLMAEAEVYRLKFKNNANAATLAALKLTHSFSRRTAVYAQVGHIKNEGALALSVSVGAAGSNPLPGRGQSGFMVGIRHIF